MEKSFAIQYMPYINLIVLIIVGIVLVYVIRAKNALISTLTEQFKSAKDLLEMYDINQLKQYTEIKVENVKEEYKQKQLKLDANTEKIIQDVSLPWIEKYNELVDLELHFLLNSSDERVKQMLNLLPKNKEFLSQLIVDIKSGKLRSN